MARATDEEFASSLLKIVLNYERYLDHAVLVAAKRYQVLEVNALRDNICGPEVGATAATVSGQTPLMRLP
jgi:hypothetical protein